MKATLTMLCVLTTTLLGYSQEKSFDLNKYKFPDYKRHELELDFKSGGYNKQQTSQYYLSPGVAEKKENSNFNNSSNLILGYQYDYLTRKRIDYLYSTFTGDYNYTKTKSDTQKIVDSRPSMHWSLYGSSKYYLIENKFFLEGFTNIDYLWDKSKRSVTDLPDEKSNGDYLDLSAGMGIGIGRMEKVSDLWQAYYMLEKLNKKGSFTRQMTEDDIFEFAKLASRLKNKRFFDARLHKIEELKGLDSLLHQQGLIRESDISYFTTLNDYWSYGNFQDRYSGMELVLKASPHYVRTFHKDKNQSNISNRSSIELNGTFSYVKQLNLYWERRILAGVSYESQFDSTGNYFRSTPGNQYFTHASMGYGYFPDSRTSISGNINYKGETIYIFNEQDARENSWMNTIYFNLTGNYYISPQLQITGQVSYMYFDKFTNTILNKKDIYYNLALRYAIF